MLPLMPSYNAVKPIAMSYLSQPRLMMRKDVHCGTDRLKVPTHLLTCSKRMLRRVKRPEKLIGTHQKGGFAEDIATCPKSRPSTPEIFKALSQRLLIRAG